MVVILLKLEINYVFLGAGRRPAVETLVIWRPSTVFEGILGVHILLIFEAAGFLTLVSRNLGSTFGSSRKALGKSRKKYSFLQPSMHSSL